MPGTRLSKWLDRASSESPGGETEGQGLLRLALVHSSYLNENPGEFEESNERLEFLGDAVIGLAAAEELFRRRPRGAEGELTELRAGLVKRATLARAARALGLGERLLMGRGEAENGGRERESNLADALEAVAGAVFHDCGYAAARDFALDALADEIDLALTAGFEANPKSLLQELAQRLDGSLPVYSLVSESGEDHARIFKVEVTVSGKPAGRGSGRRKSEAEQEAARQALEALGGAGGTPVPAQP